jgi:hypothetical protein
MISDAILFLRDVLAQKLNLPGQINVESAKTLTSEGANGVTISLINMEEEAALRNLPHTERRLGQLVKVEPPVHLNLYLLFAFEFEQYETTLVRLSEAVELFQEHRWFGPETQTGNGAVPFPAGLQRIVMEMQGMNFEALNNVWGILGGSYFPSVVYKLRLVKVQAATVAPEAEITTITLEARVT